MEPKEHKISPLDDSVVGPLMELIRRETHVLDDKLGRMLKVLDDQNKELQAENARLKREIKKRKYFHRANTIGMELSVPSCKVLDPLKISVVPRSLTIDAEKRAIAKCVMFKHFGAKMLRLDLDDDIVGAGVWCFGCQHICAHRVLGIVRLSTGQMSSVDWLPEVNGDVMPHGLLILENLDDRCISLHEYIAQRGHLLTEREIMRIGLDIISLLSHLHAKSMVHGCLTSHNVFIEHGKMDEDGALGAIVSNIGMWNASAMTDSRIKYLSPDVIDEEGIERNYEDDVWSFGVLLFEMLTGGCLPPSSSASERDTMSDKIREFFSPDCLSASMKSCPSRIASLIKCCLQLDSEERWMADSIYERLAAMTTNATEY